MTSKVDDIIENYIWIMIFCMIVSCDNGQRTNNPNTVPSEGARPNETTKNNSLKGVWNVSRLENPKCDSSNEYNIELSKILNEKVEVNDTFSFEKDSMYIKSNSNKKLEERYKYKDSTLELEGYDWIYTKMIVRQYTADSILLAVMQRNICPTNNNEPRYLLIKLVRLKS